MISYYQSVRLIEKERARLRLEEFDSPYLQGILQGLTLAIAILKVFWLETKQQVAHNPMGKRRKAA